MNKQISLALFIFVISCSSLTAQDFSRFKFGFQLSPSLSWMTTDEPKLSGGGTNLGLKLATQAEFFFAENYAISTGIGFHFNSGGTLKYSDRGRYFTNTIPDSGSGFGQEVGPNVALKYSIQYVEIPLALKLRTREFGYLTYYMEAPIFTFGFRGKSTGSLSGGGVTAATEELTINKEVSPVSVAWGFGGGVEYSVSESTRLFGGLQFSRIFTDVTKDKDYTYINRTQSGDPTAGINSITLRFGVLF